MELLHEMVFLEHLAFREKMELLCFYINKMYYCKVSSSTGSKTAFHIKCARLKKETKLGVKAWPSRQACCWWSPRPGQGLPSEHSVSGSAVSSLLRVDSLLTAADTLLAQAEGAPGTQEEAVFSNPALPDHLSKFSIGSSASCDTYPLKRILS